MTQTELELQLCKENLFFFMGYCYQHIFKKEFTFYKFHKDLADIFLRATGERHHILISRSARCENILGVVHTIARNGCHALDERLAERHRIRNRRP